MKKIKHRAQILLEPEQHQALAEIAETRQQSISHVVREIIQAYLVEITLDEEQRQSVQAIQDLTQLRKEIQDKHGFISETLLDDARDERAVELGAEWGSK